jgi:hypothetical protein
MFPQLGQGVVLLGRATHDGVVPPTARRPVASMTANPATDLERFWPSRRGHAIDEFCRS